MGLQADVGGFLGLFKPYVRLKVNKELVVPNWQLGLIYRGVQVALLYYLIRITVVEKRYLRVATPQAVFTVQTEQGNFGLSQLDMMDSLNGTYCSDLLSNYQLGPNITTQTAPLLGCRYLDFGEVVDAGSTQLRVTTQVVETSMLDAYSTVAISTQSAEVQTQQCRGMLQQIMPNMAACAWPGPAGTTISGALTWEPGKDPMQPGSSSYGVCRCTMAASYLTVAPEDIVMNIEHHYLVPLQGKTGFLPETRVRLPGSTDDIMVIPAGTPIRLALVDLLKMLKVDLDKRLNEAPNSYWLSRQGGASPLLIDGEGLYPFARVSGVRILMSFQYFDWGMEPGAPNPTGRTSQGTTKCILTLRATFAWTTVGDETHMAPPSGMYFDNSFRNSRLDRLRYGVQIDLQASGSMGLFDMYQLLACLTQVFVIMVFANALLGWVAIRVGGDAELIGNIAVDRVDMRSQLARFAAQSIAAAHTFERMDEDGGGAISHEEMYSCLRNAMGEAGELGPAETDALVDYIINSSDASSELSFHQVLWARLQGKEISWAGMAKLDEQVRGSARVKAAQTHSVGVAGWIRTFLGPPIRFTHVLKALHESNPQIFDDPSPEERHMVDMMENKRLETRARELRRRAKKAKALAGEAVVSMGGMAPVGAHSGDNPVQMAAQEQAKLRFAAGTYHGINVTSPDQQLRAVRGGNGGAAAYGNGQAAAEGEAPDDFWGNLRWWEKPVRQPPPAYGVNSNGYNERYRR